MAGTLTSISHNGISAGNQTVAKSGSERQVQKDIGDLGKALHANDVAAAQTAVASLKAAAPTQNARTDFSNAVKALDQALKTGDTKGATQAFADLQQARKQVQQAQIKGPAQDVPQRPHVAGGVDPGAHGGQQNPASTQGPSAAPPKGGGQTQALQRTAQAEQLHKTTERAFITRQDLAAKAASSKPDTGVGTKINTTA
ncbi:MAG: hypothetical protein V4582_17930 [Pseudomonadota bacterium]